MLPDPAEYSIHAIEKNPRDHYAIETWEDMNRGICPCGTTVVWNFDTDEWEEAPLRVILLTDEEIESGRSFDPGIYTRLTDVVRQQAEAQT